MTSRPCSRSKPCQAFFVCSEKSIFFFTPDQDNVKKLSVSGSPRLYSLRRKIFLEPNVFKKALLGTSLQRGRDCYAPNSLKSFARAKVQEKTKVLRLHFIGKEGGTWAIWTRRKESSSIGCTLGSEPKMQRHIWQVSQKKWPF